MSIKKAAALLAAAVFMTSGCTSIENLPLSEEAAAMTSMTEETEAEETTVGTAEEEVTTEAVTAAEEPFLFPDTRAGDILAEMTLEEKIGQMLLVSCNEENLGKISLESAPCGFVMTGGSFADAKNSAAMKEIVDGWQQQAKYGLIIAAGEEGGDFTAVSCNDQYRLIPFTSPRELYQMGGMELIKADAHEKAVLLSKVGVNLNLAPVCDLSDNPDDYIYSRALSADPETVQEYAITVIKQFKSDGVASAIRHFPGYGSNSDIHTGIPVDSRSEEQIKSADFLPFQAGIAAGAEAVVMSHIIMECADPIFPASLSPAVHEMLRSELGYSGVIIADELSLQPLLQYASDKGELAVMAVKAGNDLLCTEGFDEEAAALIQAVKSGEISENAINRSVLRILELKLKLGVIE